MTEVCECQLYDKGDLIQELKDELADIEERIARFSGGSTPHAATMISMWKITRDGLLENIKQLERSK